MGDDSRKIIRTDGFGGGRVIYEIPESAGKIVGSMVTRDRRFLLFDCARATVIVEIATERVELAELNGCPLLDALLRA